MLRCHWWCGCKAPTSSKAEKFSPIRAWQLSRLRPWPKLLKRSSMPSRVVKFRRFGESSKSKYNFMAILVNKNTRVLTQGITGATGQFHTKACKDYGTQMVAGVTPGKGGTEFEGIPIFDTVEQAVRKTGANASVIYVPPPFA